MLVKIKWELVKSSLNNLLNENNKFNDNSFKLNAICDLLDTFISCQLLFNDIDQINEETKTLHRTLSAEIIQFLHPYKDLVSSKVLAWVKEHRPDFIATNLIPISEINYPIIIYKDEDDTHVLSLDLSSGDIRLHNSQVSKVPLDLAELPQYQKFIGPVRVSALTTRVQIITPGRDQEGSIDLLKPLGYPQFMFYFSPKLLKVMHHQINVNNNLEWFELQNMIHSVYPKRVYQNHLQRLGSRDRRHLKWTCRSHFIVNLHCFGRVLIEMMHFLKEEIRVF